MTRQTEIPAINVLLAYAELRDRDQVFFNGKLNEFVFASRSSKREFIRQWQRALAATGTTPIDTNLQNEGHCQVQSDLQAATD
ncbi:hypothetical protein [Paraburkholderia sp. UCT2]|uniref:hypothetical protein n=1 Tax=Paraburkholderia sp. UCT2 TaxID=2615208 RepID=UPI0016560627|nr:hypothetical protein [Paraburkholderia sp. UCT2]MBC8731995.1 hypothetical protein [Paraburkholderia sp. UCT2]